jgi:hypothetical protein
MARVSAGRGVVMARLTRGVPPVYRRRPRPGCRARDACACLVGLSAVNVALRLPHIFSGSSPPSGAGSGLPIPPVMLRVGKAPCAPDPAAAGPPGLPLLAGRSWPRVSLIGPGCPVEVG